MVFLHTHAKILKNRGNLMLTSECQEEKKAVLAYYEALESAPNEALVDVIAAHVSENYLWRGFHPFDEHHGAASVAEAFWRPFKASFQPVQRRMDIFMAGSNSLTSDKDVWVVSMGHLMGLFDAPWLGIAPTGKLAFLRYYEFNRIEAGKIAETAMYFDIPHLMMQAGLHPFPT